MDTVYIKLLAVFTILAVIRLSLVAKRVPSRVRTTVAEYTDSGIIASVVAIFVVTFLLQVSRVEGASMQPTLATGEYTLVDKVTYLWREPQRGDIIVFRAPDGSGADYIKRVIALPGEKIAVRGGRVFVNRRPLSEAYESHAPEYDFPERRVPRGHLFVLGDNRNSSFDSHLWDDPFLPLDSIHGRARLVLWPMPRFGSIEGHPTPALRASHQVR
jgi:signal peptidase I